MVPTGTCVVQGGVLAPGGACLGDLNQNGVDDACEIVSAPEACCPPDGRCYMELPELCKAAGECPKVRARSVWATQTVMGSTTSVKGDR